MGKIISIIGSNMGMAMIAIIGVIVGGAITITAMNITIKKNKELQIRNEMLTQCENIEMLVAEYCTLTHKLFRSSKQNRERMKSDNFENTIYAEEIENLKDEIDTIIFKIEMKATHINDLDYLVQRLKQLKDMPCYIFDNTFEEYSQKTCKLREELSGNIKKIKEKM